MNDNIKEYNEPKKKRTPEELSADLQELNRRSKERQVELKKLGIDIQLLYKQLKLDFPEEFER